VLRIVLAAAGALALIAGIALVIAPPHAGWGIAVFGGLVLLSLAFEGRYRTSRAATEAKWEPTGEKFIDPGTGRLVEVDYDPRTGERNDRQT
jgi:hypothetical protein